jgi:predicted TIM-barrel fold metal-dependent hydrolase
MAHLCGCGYRGVEFIADFPNVYVDTSGGQAEDGFLQYAVKRIGANRLLYG